MLQEQWRVLLLGRHEQVHPVLQRERRTQALGQAVGGGKGQCHSRFILPLH
uniref:Uncharacterized protein n=1 Tax=Setaria viridis TaxID=4556 RepID=A0A4U6UX31_SETVI|nr:hypothetical protein SEVIR_4G011101v2 [Setaria viridis]